LLVSCSVVLAADIGAFAERSAETRDGTPMSQLWVAPKDLQSQDLFNGPWGANLAPDPNAVYTFVRPKRDGANPGMTVRDPLGRIWHVKQSPEDKRGAEGPVEVALSRVLSAIGYHQPPVYFLPTFTLADNSGTHPEPGGRFRLDEPSLRDDGSWSLRKNPFSGTRPFQGLVVTLLMFNSWDLKDSNNTVYEVQQGNGAVDRWYVVRDLGGALGESGRFRPTRNNIEKFEHHSWLSGVSDDRVVFRYGGKDPELVHTINIDDLKWACNLVGGLTDQQWNDAFRAGGYPPEMSARFIRKIRANVEEGRQLAGQRQLPPGAP